MLPRSVVKRFKATIEALHLEGFNFVLPRLG
jgi:hypothetical protein